MLKKDKKDILFIVLTIFMSIWFIWRYRFGYGGYDEPFYINLNHKIYTGGKYIINEWNLAQFFSLITLPIYYLFRIFFKNTEGIFLFYRYTYLFFQIFITIFIYCRLKKLNIGYISVLVSLIYYIFTPVGIPNLSYNTIGVMVVSMITVIITTSKLNKMVAFELGVLYSLLVLCNPYTVILILPIIVYSLFLSFKKEYDIRILLFFLCGTILLAIPSIIFFLSKANIFEYLSSLHNIFSIDNTHGKESILSIFFNYAWVFFWSDKWSNLGSGSLVALLLLVFILRKKEFKEKETIFFLAGIFSLLILNRYSHNLITLESHHIYFPITIMGGISYYSMSNEKQKKYKDIYNWLLIGVLYSFFMSLASDTRVFAIGTGLLISTLPSVILILEYIKEERGIYKRSMIVGYLLLSLFLGIMLYIKHNYIFAEDDTKILNTKILNGPLKGVITTKEKVEEYNILYFGLKDSLKTVGYKEGEGVLIIDRSTWAPMVNDMYNCTYTAWSENIIEELEKYYSLNPDVKNKVKYIYIPNNLFGKKIMRILFPEKKYKTINNGTAFMYILE
jgi:membrane protein